jgi:CDP-diglyceride synthetase
MMNTLPQYYFLIAILVCAGATNMAFVKLPILSSLSRPMDGGVLLSDGKRLFGDNKTWKGFVGMIAITAVCLAGAGSLATNVPYIQQLSLIPFHELKFPFNAWFFGALWGLAYVLAELPNSFLKRRIDIPPGENARGMKGFFCLILDQADSVIGCVLVLPLFSNITWLDAVTLIVLGSIAHYLANLGLYVVHLKRQAG